MEIESVDKSDFFRYSEVIIWCKEGVHMTLEAQEYYNIAAWLKEKVVVICITDARGKLNANHLPAQDSWFLLYSNTTDPNKMIYPGRLIPQQMCSYSFLDKDSMVQCEEIRAVSKARFDMSRGCIGRLEPGDLALLKNKFRRAFDF